MNVLNGFAVTLIIVTPIAWALVTWMCYDDIENKEKSNDPHYSAKKTLKAWGNIKDDKEAMTRCWYNRLLEREAYEVGVGYEH